MKAFRILLTAVVFAGTPAMARDVFYRGGRIVIIDLKSGKLIRQLGQPVEDGRGPLEIDADPGMRSIRVSWNEYSSTVTTIHRQIELLTPDFSTGTTSSKGPWKSAALKPLISTTVAQTMVDAQPPPGVKTLQFSGDWEVEKFFAKKVSVISRDGYGIDALEKDSGKKVWSLDLNPENDPLPGPSPNIQIYEIGSILLVATNRLGLWSVEESTGKVYWRLSYKNVDVIPDIARLEGQLILGPVTDLPSN